MVLRSLLHKALTVTVDDVVHHIVLLPVGDGWHEAVGVPVEVCEILQMVKRSPDEYVVLEDPEPERVPGPEKDALTTKAEDTDRERKPESEEETEPSDPPITAGGENPTIRKPGRPRKN
jgi:hypothetical protein